MVAINTQGGELEESRKQTSEKRGASIKGDGKKQHIANKDSGTLEKKNWNSDLPRTRNLMGGSRKTRRKQASGVSCDCRGVVELVEPLIWGREKGNNNPVNQWEMERKERKNKQKKQKKQETHYNHRKG